MKIPIEKQIDFFSWQIKEHEDEFQKYLNTSLNTLFKSSEAYVSRVWGYDADRGFVIFRFKKNLCPRLKYPLQAITYKLEPEMSVNPFSWDFSYKTFRDKYSLQSTEVNPVYYLKNEDKEWAYIGCNNIEVDFIEKIVKYLEKGEKVPVIFAELDPPIRYLLNLKNFIKTHQNNQILHTDFVNSYENWNPTILSSEINIPEFLLNEFEHTNEIVIQGPPGTGKSYLIAKIVSELMYKNKAVCICSLTNKALMEVAEKEGLKEHLKNKKISKTRLTIEESKQLVGLKNAKELTVERGSLLLSTYYKLSEWFNETNQPVKEPIFDLLVIEEASQAYLTTIAAFKKLAYNLLIIGDPLQLTPIVLNENHGEKIHPLILNYARGLESYVVNSKVISWRLTDSYRLTKKQTQLTGFFYNNQLKSVSKTENQFADFEIINYLPVGGGTIVKYLDLTELSENSLSIKLIRKIFTNLIANNSNIKLALLSPFRKTVKFLQSFLRDLHEEHLNLTIDTVDRVQGLTVDYTIYLIPMSSNPSFSFHLNRFNVATSRSQYATLILADYNIKYIKGINYMVNSYLNNCIVLTETQK
jgi:superfamily I DNA and/or RNA helicase